MQITQKYIWDYDVSKMDFSKPEVKAWYLERKIQSGDWACLDKKTLKKYLPGLKINPYLKQILTKFIQKNA